jgi:hypothetical protein
MKNSIVAILIGASINLVGVFVLFTLFVSNPIKQKDEAISNAIQSLEEKLYSVESEINSLALESINPTSAENDTCRQLTGIQLSIDTLLAEHSYKASVQELEDMQVQQLSDTVDEIRQLLTTPDSNNQLVDMQLEEILRRVSRVDDQIVDLGLYLSSRSLLR